LPKITGALSDGSANIDISLSGAFSLLCSYSSNGGLTLGGLGLAK
jgi:hypothetical protein